MARSKKQRDVVEGDIGEFKVSQSKVKVWRKCHYAYHLRYVEKLRKKVKSRPLQFGTIVHSMLEADAEGDDPFAVLSEIGKSNEKMFRAQREMYGEIIDDVRQIMTEYFDRWTDKDFRFDRINKRNGEHVFNIELVEFGLSGVIWNGKIDAIGKTPNKLRWGVEHKTFSRKPSDDERWRNLQSTSYIKAIRMLGWGDVSGICWDYIKSKSPTRPMLLKNGEISQKNIDTLPITVRETLSEYKLNPKNYKGFLERTEQGLSDWFQRIFTPVREDVVENVFSDFIFSVRDMVEHHGVYRDKNIDRHCSWCDFEKICRAELQGDDVAFVMQKDYTHAKEDERENTVPETSE